MTNEGGQPSAEELRRQLESARDAYERARETERELRHAERRRERDAHREERSHAREERHRLHRGLGFLGESINMDLGDILGGFGGPETSESVTGDFTVTAMPTVRIRNVSGETTVKGGPAGSVHVVARKYVHGVSGDRAKRLLENFELRMEQNGDEITIAPHLYEQERSWSRWHRGGRVGVDLSVTVPEETRLDCQTVSGELSITGTRGPLEAQSVSGDVEIRDVRGPLRLKTVSGSAVCARYGGALDANSVSGDVSLIGCRLREADLVSVSGDVEIDAELDAAGEHRVKTISGDVDLALPGSSYEIDYSSMSGDLRCEVEAQISREDKRHKRVRIGDGAAKVRVKTVSGDLVVKRSGESVPDAGAAPHAASASAPGESVAETRADDARTVLERLARGELGVEQAAEALDSIRRSR